MTLRRAEHFKFNKTVNDYFRPVSKLYVTSISLVLMITCCPVSSCNINDLQNDLWKPTHKQYKHALLEMPHLCKGVYFNTGSSFIERLLQIFF